MKKLIAALATAGLAASTLALSAASPAGACEWESRYQVAGETVFAKDSAPFGPSHGGPLYLDFRKYEPDSENSKKDSGVTLFVPKSTDTGHVVDVAWDLWAAPVHFWIYAETNGKANLQRGMAANPAYTALENEDDECGKPSKNPDLVLY